MHKECQGPIFMTPQSHISQGMTTTRSGVAYTHRTQGYGTKEHKNQESKEI